MAGTDIAFETLTSSESIIFPSALHQISVSGLTPIETAISHNNLMFIELVFKLNQEASYILKPS